MDTALKRASSQAWRQASPRRPTKYTSEYHDEGPSRKLKKEKKRKEKQIKKKSTMFEADMQPKMLTPAEARRRCKDKRTRVKLAQDQAWLDAMGNLMSDSYTSFMDAVTGLLTMCTVYYNFEKRPEIFLAAFAMFLLNAIVRVVIGIKVSPPARTCAHQ